MPAPGFRPSGLAHAPPLRRMARRRAERGSSTPSGHHRPRPIGQAGHLSARPPQRRLRPAPAPSLRRSVRTTARNRSRCVPAGGGERRILGLKARSSPSWWREGMRRRRAAGKVRAVRLKPPGGAQVVPAARGPARGHQQRWRRVGGSDALEPRGTVATLFPRLERAGAQRPAPNPGAQIDDGQQSAHQVWRSLTVPSSHTTRAPVTMRLGSGPC